LNAQRLVDNSHILANFREFSPKPERSRKELSKIWEEYSRQMLTGAGLKDQVIEANTHLNLILYHDVFQHGFFWEALCELNARHQDLNIGDYSTKIIQGSKFIESLLSGNVSPIYNALEFSILDVSTFIFKVEEMNKRKIEIYLKMSEIIQEFEDNIKEEDINTQIYVETQKIQGENGTKPIDYSVPKEYLAFIKNNLKQLIDILFEIYIKFINLIKDKLKNPTLKLRYTMIIDQILECGLTPNDLILAGCLPSHIGLSPYPRSKE